MLKKKAVRITVRHKLSTLSHRVSDIKNLLNKTNKEVIFSINSLIRNLFSQPRQVSTSEFKGANVLFQIPKSSAQLEAIAEKVE